MGLFSYAFGNSKPKPRAKPNPRTARTVTRHQPVVASPKVKRKNHTHVRPDTTPLIEKRGWKQKGRNQWVGYYVCNAGTFPGKIIQRGDIFDVLILRPPSQIKDHHKFSCFIKQPQPGWFNVHLHTQPIDMDVSSVIFYVEKLLNQALKRG